MATVYSDSGKVWLHYEINGEGRDDVVLVHGFASNHDDNWVQTGWLRRLARAGHRVVALDCRGHGRSDTPHDPEDYALDRMADDVLDVMAYASVRKGHLMGYSMGASIVLNLLLRHPERFRSAVLAGTGDGILTGRHSVQSDAIADALLAERIDGITDPGARAFRDFAERGDNDLRALAACMRRGRSPFDPEALARIEVPVLLVLGEKDTLVGSAETIAAAIPGARLELVPGDHLTAAAAPRYKEVVLSFFEEVKAARRRA